LQTELYIPPPVVDGKIPKNNFGNIDIYVPSMVPAGAVHIIRPSIALAADFAGIDYAEAVTGFDFTRNKATARVKGIVVAKENVAGLLTIWEGMMERVQEEEERLRRKAMLERWQRFYIKLGVKQRLDERHGKLDEDTEIGESERLGPNGFVLESSDNNTTPLHNMHVSDVSRKVDSSEVTIDRHFTKSPISRPSPSNQGIVESTEFSQSISTGVSYREGAYTAFVEQSEALLDKISDSNPINSEDEEGGGFIVENGHDEVDSDFRANPTPADGEEDDEEEFDYEEDDGIL
jgi:hypothetical protein